MVVGMEQFDQLVQQVRGLTEAVQAMQQQQQQPQASVRMERASLEFQNPAIGWATWASPLSSPEKGSRGRRALCLITIPPLEGPYHYSARRPMRFVIERISWTKGFKR